MCECFTRLTGKDWSHHPDLTRFHFLEQIRKQMGRGDRLLQGHTAQKWQRWALPTSLTSILAQFNPKSLRLSFIYIYDCSLSPLVRKEIFFHLRTYKLFFLCLAKNILTNKKKRLRVYKSKIQEVTIGKPLGSGEGQVWLRQMETLPCIAL